MVTPPKEKKLSDGFFQSFLKCSLSMSVSKNTIEKIGHRACLREMTGQTYSIYASTSTLSRALFYGTFFGGWVFKVKIKKKDRKGTKSGT